MRINKPVRTPSSNDTVGIFQRPYYPYYRMDIQFLGSFCRALKYKHKRNERKKEPNRIQDI